MTKIELRNGKASVPAKAGGPAFRTGMRGTETIAVDDVVATHRVCHRFQAPILARGCGTSLSGETVNYAVVIDFSKYLHAVFEVDTERRTVRCQPGAINEQVNLKTGPQGFVFAPDPSTHSYCTIG